MSRDPRVHTRLPPSPSLPSSLSLPLTLFFLRIPPPLFAHLRLSCKQGMGPRSSSKGEYHGPRLGVAKSIKFGESLNSRGDGVAHALLHIYFRSLRPSQGRQPRCTCDRTITTQLAKRWISTKCSISQLTFLFVLIQNKNHAILSKKCP